MPTGYFRYFVRMAYDGSAFNGWQIQPGAASIQEETEHCLSLLLRSTVRLTGAGRTDTGVHAKEFFAHFDCPLSPEEIDSLQLPYKANRMLPPSVAIYNVFHVPDKTHARFHALNRTYHYLICREKDPFYAGKAWLNERGLDIEKMQEATTLLLEYADFASFAKSNTQVKTTLCNVDRAFWEKKDHLLRFEIRANRFLRNMVRSVVGTLVDVGLGKISRDDFRAIIEAKDRGKAGFSAPACGLYLANIRYPEGILPVKQ